MGNLCDRYPNRRPSSRRYSQRAINFTPKECRPIQVSHISPYHSRKNSYSPRSQGVISQGQSGLDNKGNTCFANAALQCILNTPILISYFTGRDISQMAHIAKFTSAFHTLFNSQWKTKQEKTDPTEILNLVWNNNQVFKPGRQNDAHEFLLYLLDQLHEELKMPFPRINFEYSEKSEKSWEKYMNNNYSVISKEFQGQLQTNLICSECNYVKKKFEAFMYLSLSIPDKPQIKIEDCLEKFCEEEFLTDEEKWYCKKCEKLVETTKKTDIIRLPQYLIIHLKRFKDIHVKINDLVYYDETLDLGRFVTKNQNERNFYKIYAKIKHMGSISGGHYVASAKQGEDWYCFNDGYVRKEPFSSCTETYVLFYERSYLDSLDFAEKIENPEISSPNSLSPGLDT